MQGTFYYDETSKSLYLKRDDHEKIGVLPIVLVGDSKSSIHPTQTEYQSIELWLNAEEQGEKAVIATAQKAPKAFGLAYFLAYLLCLPRYLAKVEKCCYRSHRQPNSNQEYKCAPSATFMPEFRRLLHLHGREILRGYSMLLGLLLGFCLGSYLF